LFSQNSDSNNETTGNVGIGVEAGFYNQTGQYNTLIGAGAVYVYSSDTHSGGRDLQRRLTGNRLEIEDAGDNDYDDLTVSPSQGRFTSESRWEANW
jgi:hypothetical protein